ncbi:hypothetical protein SAMN05428642_102645 [Flaviramulus basaltis]|uniref:Uncharacterized protein n=1 Tax=Flaviramulus basaltis TaxID=369401 RepID=A0A1K2IIT5_9FLAO|nr:hypothetical protein [Flaviramulus basaltis]SFZ92303.1 hypothetical protein SAMN05428642_102645 [Flaviramulus basaltis]
MNKLQIIENKITKLTTLIETQYPELYTFLEETPLTMPSINHPDINTQVMEDYLESLRHLLEHHIEIHKNK